MVQGGPERILGGKGTLKDSFDQFLFNFRLDFGAPTHIFWSVVFVSFLKSDLVHILETSDIAFLFCGVGRLKIHRKLHTNDWFPMFCSLTILRVLCYLLCFVQVGNLTKIEIVIQKRTLQ